MNIEDLKILDANIKTILPKEKYWLYSIISQKEISRGLYRLWDCGKRIFVYQKTGCQY